MHPHAPDERYLKRTDLPALGFTEALIKKLLPAPDMTQPARFGYRYWYLRSRVDQAMKEPAFVDALRGRAARAEKPGRRRAEFSHRYMTYRQAIPAACHGLLSLNRYAKHRTCSGRHREEIYRLKNAWIEFLYGEGVCTAAWVHIQTLPAKKCRACGGSGDEGECDRCDGTGNYLPEKQIRFWVFQFKAGGQTYTWHQPEDLVKWQVTATSESASFDGVEHDKPLEISRSRLAEVKDLIRWVMERHGSETPPVEHFSMGNPETIGGQQASLFYTES
jgi:hypothetical protein